MPRDWENDGLPPDWLTAASVITELKNALAAEKAINAALNAQIDSIQSEDHAQIKYLEDQIDKYKRVNKMQAEAIDRVNEEIVILKQAAPMAEDLRYKLRSIRDIVYKHAKDV